MNYRRLAKYAYPINSLGETICLGCGDHLLPSVILHPTQPRSYCGINCRMRVRRRGGRLTRQAVAQRIATLCASA